MIINSRTDLDTIVGTPEHAAFIRMLEGSLWKLEKTDEGWQAVEDDSTIQRFGFARADFPHAVPPALPVEVPPTPEELLAQAKAARATEVDAIVVTTISGKTFDGNEQAQERMSRAITALDPGETTLWVLADNTPATVTRDELREALRLAGEAQTAIWVRPYL